MSLKINKKGRVPMSLRNAILATLIFAAFAAGSPQQEKKQPEITGNFEITGTVKDSSGGVLPGVLVTAMGSSATANTDNTGYFALKGLPAGQITVVASLPGFARKETGVLIQPGQTPRIEIFLELEAKEYSVLVEQDVPKLMNASDMIGVVSVVPRQIATLPSLGEKDLFRSFQLMPGISGTMESSSGLYVRGGTPDQNLVLFDGFTVYKVDHFFGIFSAFNPNAVENMTLHKGGFESKYGSRISSVVDLTGKSGDKKELRMGGGFSLLSYNGYVDGPLGKKGTFFIAGRRSFSSPLSSRIKNNYTSTAGSGGGPNNLSVEPSSNFYDVNARGTYALSPKDNLVASLYFGTDNFDNSRTLDIPNFGTNQDRTLAGEIIDYSHWGNGGASINWSRDWTNTFTSNLTFAVSHYFKNAHRVSVINSQNKTVGSRRNFDNNSYENNRVNDQTARLSNSWLLGSNHFVEFGAEYIQNKITYNYIFSTDLGEEFREGSSSQQALYLQDRIKLTPKLEITPGIRAARYGITKKFYAEPRLAGIYHVSNRLRLKAAGGIYNQFIADVVRENPFQGDQDVWTLADGNVVPVSRAEHYIGGASWENDKFLFDVEAYHKTLKGLVEFASLRRGGIRPPDPSETIPQIDFNTLYYRGKGKAEGVEFLAQKKFGTNTGWFTYTLGRVYHNFPNYQATDYPASHDSTHEVKIVDTHRWKAFTFSGNWVYATGKPITVPSSYEEDTLPNGRIFTRPVYTSKNGSRLPEYHRLDLSATWDFYRGENNSARMGFSVFNAYNHANVWRREYAYYDGQQLTTDINYLGLTFSGFVNFDLTPPSEKRVAGPAWTKADPKLRAAEKPTQIFEFYGRVVSMSSDRINVETKMGTKEFLLRKSTVKGEPEFEKGAYIHVYYRPQTEGNVITMVVRKVGRHYQVPPSPEATGEAATTSN
jgi:ferric enterobactin receptor